MKKTIYTKAGVVKFDLDKLEGIQKAFGTKFVAQVGILGSKTTRHSATKAGKRVTTQTNAEIGLLHEKGSLSQHLPRRSFLMDPLQYKSKGLMAIKQKLWEVFTSPEKEQTMPRLRKAYTDLGNLAVRIINAAFRTGGFGRWKPSKKIEEYKSRHPHATSTPQTLIDSHQLERSIDSRVVVR